MADAELIARLRTMVNEPDSTTYSDQNLSDVIDQADGSLDLAAVDIWEQKAGSFSTLVDTSESGSSRSMSQLAKAAVAQAQYYSKKVNDAKVEVVSEGRTVIRKAVRG